MKKIPFNKPYLSGKELEYIKDATISGKLSGNGKYTEKCQLFFEKKYNFKKCLLTTSCTDALEMAAMLIDIEFGDEVIMPSYTFVSTANAFILRGAKIVFADSNELNPNIDTSTLELLITPKTKAIIVVHYAGIACDMDKIMEIAERNNVFVIEDSAQAINSFYKAKPLGSIGHLATLSFHETKNIISGEGGLLVINDERFIKRAEILLENGTNRAAFLKGKIKKYEWIDIGSSFFPSELTAAFLYAQLENIDNIQAKRNEIWERYFNEFSKHKEFKGKLPVIPDYATNNAHMFYINCSSGNERNKLILELKNNGISAVFHYIPLHTSPYFKHKHDGRELKNCDKFSNSIVRLPLFYDLAKSEQQRIINTIVSLKQISDTN